MHQVQKGVERSIFERVLKFPLPISTLCHFVSPSEEFDRGWIYRDIQALQFTTVANDSNGRIGNVEPHVVEKAKLAWNKAHMPCG